jgi:hypothetical protein
MGEIADMDADNYYSSYWEEEYIVKCKFCDEDNLYWGRIGDKWRLFNDKDKEHICKYIKYRIKLLKGDI